MLFDPVFMPDQFFEQDIPVSHPVPQFPNFFGWDIAGSQQTRPQKCGDPVCIFNVRFLPWHIFHVMWVGNDDVYLPIFIENGLQYIVNGKPVHACTLHRYIATVIFDDPFFEFVQALKKRGKFLYERLRLRQARSIPPADFALYHLPLRILRD